MELSNLQQAADYINKSRKILLALPTHVTVDRFCSSYALDRVLAKMSKETKIISSTTALPHVGFLTDMPEISSSFASGDNLVITVATNQTELEELSYQTNPEAVQIYLKPKTGGQFSPSDVTVGSGQQEYDLIITFGAQTLEDLGELYQKNTDLFFNTPKINLDIAAGNEYFGTINFIDVTASSLAEVVAQIIAALEQAVTDEQIATGLLGGIIANTHSFQDPSTTPKTLITASALISQGAHQQEIIQALYKTKDFSLLKLWGRALARIKTVPDASLLYSVLTQSDFEKTGENADRLMLVLRELLENVTGFQVIALLGEEGRGTRLLIAGLPHSNISRLVRKLTGVNVNLLPLLGLYQVAVFTLEQSLTEAEQQLLSAVNS